MAKNQDAAPTFPAVIETVQCDIRGFEEVEVDINVLATKDELDSLPNKVRNDSEQNVVKDIRNWPADKFGKEPVGRSAPVIFTAWLAQRAVSKALDQYMNDPNSLTA